MPVPFLGPEEIANLSSILRDAGYSVGIGQCLAAERLMVTLASEGKRFSDRGELKSWLAPIFCTTPTEQADFSRLFTEWLIRRNEAVGKPETPDFESPKQESAQSKTQVSRLRRVIAASALVIAVGAASFSAYQIRHELIVRTLRVSVVDQLNAPVTKSSLTFRGAAIPPDHDNQFTLHFRLLDLPAKVETQKDGFNDTIELDTSNYLQPVTLHVGPRPEAVEVKAGLQTQNRLILTAAEVDYLKQAILVEGSAVKYTEAQPETTWERIYRRHYRHLSIAASLLPLLLLGVWLFWMHLPRLQLIRWKGQSDIQLNTLRVSGSGSQFFNSPGFRRIAQQLRRHRLTETSDLDAERTVLQSAHRGGWFTPVYLWRQRLPNYLVLIDRAGFRDLQGRLIDDFVRSLLQGRLEVDCYDFYSDPRICYLRTETSPSGVKKSTYARVSTAFGEGSSSPNPRLTATSNEAAKSHRFVLDDLLAKHPNHILLILSDTAGFYSSVTGKLQPWVERLSLWTFRALFVPETMVSIHSERRAEILHDAGFLTLPATEDGLLRAVEILDSGQAGHVVGRWRTDSAAPYPSLLLGDDVRWMSDLPPRPAHRKLVVEQLRVYLGEEAFAWLCACAIYPELSWDLTLYLGNALRALGADGRRLASLLRLPWFRRGSMPNWLRQNLTDAMSLEERQRVRDALWSLLETALDKPLDHFELRYATHAKETTLYAKLKALFLRSLLKNFLRTEPDESALRDYVFLSVLHGRKSGKGLGVPNKLRRLWGHYGQPRRPVIQSVVGVLAATAVSIAVYHYRAKPLAVPSAEPLPAPTGPAPYHLSLDKVISPEVLKSIESAGALVFQTTGDTGGVENPLPQEVVAAGLASQFRDAFRPAFLYLLGNLVFYDGGAKNYYDQFYRPYRDYPGPIFAIAGNRDGTPALGQVSLDAFVRNFCAPNAAHTAEAGGLARTAMTQPNPYWTLETPFATIIGMYTNVVAKGFIDNGQSFWLISELKKAPPEKALIVAMNQPLYSMSVANGSEYLGSVLDRAMLTAGRAPDLVLSAYENNYQRFSRSLGTQGRLIPYVISGAGGYPHLQGLPRPSPKLPLRKSPDVTLESFDDTNHGFLRLTMSLSALTGEYFAVNESGTVGAPMPKIVDSFTVHLNNRTGVAPARQAQRLNRPVGKVAPGVTSIGSAVASSPTSPKQAQTSLPNLPSQPNTVDPQLIDKLAAAKKPAVGQPLVIGGQMVCGPKGNTPDSNMQELNNNKNRTDEPGDSDYIAVSWSDMNNLPAGRVNDIQGAPVSVVGYLSNRVKEQTEPPGETTNCNLLNPDEVDWHVYLTEAPNQPIQSAIIVETTPRVRANHNWTTAMLAPYVNQNKQVRISGWLMYDFQHLGVVGTARSTVWEIHPITKIEVQDLSGNWVNIEQ